MAGGLFGSSKSCWVAPSLRAGPGVEFVRRWRCEPCGAHPEFSNGQRCQDDAKMMPENWRIPSARGCSLTYLETGSRNRIRQMSNCLASDFSFLSGNAVWGDIPGVSYLDSADCRRTLLQWPFLELVATDVGSLSLLHSPHPAVIPESRQCHPCHLPMN